MVDPSNSQENPHLVEAMHAALEHSIVTSDTPTQRAALSGQSYRLSPIYDITTTEGSVYLYIGNPTSNFFLLNEDTISITGGNAKTFVYHSPDVDLSTFTQGSFSNSLTGADGIQQTAYFGFDNNVTINDKGEEYEKDFVIASSGSVGSTSTGSGDSPSVDFVISPNDSAMLEIMNDTSSDTITVSVSAEFHEMRTDIPDTTQ